MHKTHFKIAGILAVLAVLVVVFGTGNAVAGFTNAVAGFTRFFNMTAVAVFVVASTVGLATRLRA